MKKTVLLLLTAALLTSCGAGQTESYDGFKTDVDYKYEKIDWVKADNFKNVVETYYSNSYVHFTRHSHQYRFSYIISQGSFDFYYDDLGFYEYSNGNPLLTDYRFTLVDGVRMSGESTYRVSFKYVNSKMIASVYVVENSGENTNVAKFSMAAVETIIPTYASDYSHVIYGIQESGRSPSDELVDTFRDSKVKYGSDNSFYFTYQDMYTSTQRCTVKEEGVVLNTPFFEGESDRQTLQITKRTKYFHGEEVSSENVSLRYAITIDKTDIGTTSISITKFAEEYNWLWNVNYAEESYLRSINVDLPL